ncbi:MAG: 50S ribosomal protein L15 [Candidatus Omnitrophota bacterium]
MELTKLIVRTKRKTTKRLGRGSGSGWGKTSGRGNKGAGSRSGKVLPYVGFNGGNIPFLRKIPKRGFVSHFEEYQVTNLSAIVRKMKDAKEIDPLALKMAHLIKDDKKPVKILAHTQDAFTLKATFKADSFSAKAKELIEKAGGTIECLKR